MAWVFEILGEDEGFIFCRVNPKFGNARSQDIHSHGIQNISASAPEGFTHWPLEDVVAILKVSFSNSFYRTIARAFAVRWFSGECHRPSLMKINWCNCYIHEYYTANSLRTVFETIPEACTKRVSERSWILYLIWITIYPVLYLNQLATEEILNLTHWGRDKMAAIFQCIFVNKIAWILIKISVKFVP